MLFFVHFDDMEYIYNVTITDMPMYVAGAASCSCRTCVVENMMSRFRDVPIGDEEQGGG